MNKEYAKILSCVQKIREVTDFVPDVAIVLGSGLGGFADKIDKVVEIDYHNLEGFPVSTVSGHKGKFIFGYVGKTKVVCMQGRVHYYEGYSASEVVLPIRVMRVLGAKILLLTNASGGINRNYKAGDLMQIMGHISSFVPSPLIGENIDELGVRFPDMSEVYDKKLLAKINTIASINNIELKQGVYLQTTGPNYETPEEIKMFGSLGADAVGMSTAIEAMAGVHCGMRVAGISLITNMASGISQTKLTHDEVQMVANNAQETFEKLVYNVLSDILD